MSAENSHSTEVDTMGMDDILSLSTSDATRFPRVYCDHLEVIHQYNANDVRGALEKAEMGVLFTLRSLLCDRVMTICPQFKDRRMVIRKKQNTIVEDIFNLGKCILDKGANKAVEKIFNDPLEQSLNDSPSTQILHDNIGDIFKVMDNLSNKISALEAEVISLKEDNSKLHAIIENNIFHRASSSPQSSIEPGLSNTETPPRDTGLALPNSQSLSRTQDPGSNSVETPIVDECTISPPPQISPLPVNTHPKRF